MSKGLFDHINEITKRQSVDYMDTLSESDKKTWSNYMISRFLSMNMHWTELVNELQQFTATMRPSEYYRLYIDLLPKGNTFLRYVKGKSDDKYEDFLIDHIRTEYECSKTQAIDYLQILYSTEKGKKSIKSICESYGEDPKKIRKLKLGV